MKPKKPYKSPELRLLTLDEVRELERRYHETTLGKAQSCSSSRDLPKTDETELDP